MTGMFGSGFSDDHRPLGLTLLSGLYLFFLLVSASTFGNPFPFMGSIYSGTPAKVLVIADCLICLYLLIGIIKQQYLTWYLLIGYNSLEIVNTIVNVKFIPLAEVERAIGAQVSQDGLWVNNIAASLAILLLTQYIYRSKKLFVNRRRYLF
jgi:hypothetical protein